MFEKVKITKKMKEILKKKNIWTIVYNSNCDAGWIDIDTGNLVTDCVNEPVIFEQAKNLLKKYTPKNNNYSINIETHPLFLKELYYC